jgi:Protein of unknown function (DUF3800)
MSGRFLYVFLDEAGNFDFSKNGTRLFVLGALTVERPFNTYPHLLNLKYDLIERGIDLEYFHAAEDRQAVRDRVFDIIRTYLGAARVDTLIVEKRKTGAALRHDERFYPEMLGYLLRFVIEKEMRDFSKIVVFTDRIPVRKKRKAVEKAVKQTLAKMLPARVSYCILHHDSKSNFGLQIADYLTWAVYREWDQTDGRSYDLIRQFVRSEFDIFRAGTTYYY